MKLAIVLLAMAFALSAIGDEAGYRVGDYWTYSRTQTRPTAATALSKQWTRKIYEIAPDGRIRTDENGAFFNFDRNFNPLSKFGSEYDQNVSQSPNFVGKSWNYKRKVNPDVPDLYEYGEFKTVAFETVTVPAGTFECYHIIGEIKQDSKYHALQEYVERWGCPALRHPAKIIIKRVGRTYGGGPGIFDTEVSELVDSSRLKKNAQK